MSGTLLPGAEEGLYMEGPVGTGKTTRTTGHPQGLLGRGVPARELLVFLPQRALAAGRVGVVLRLQTGTEDLPVRVGKRRGGCHQALR